MESFSFTGKIHFYFCAKTINRYYDKLRRHRQPMSDTAATRARRLRSVKNALFGLAGTFSWTLFWDNSHTVEPVDDHHEDHVFDHKWAFARKLDDDKVRPINLGSAHIKIFDETVKVLIDLFALSYCFPEMNIRKEAHARISYALGRAVQSVRDFDFTAAVLEFIVGMTSDGELKAAVNDTLLESLVSKAYDPTPFIDRVPEAYRSGATKALLSGLKAPEDASAIYFAVEEWVQWQ